MTPNETFELRNAEVHTLDIEATGALGDAPSITFGLAYGQLTRRIGNDAACWNSKGC